MRRGVRVELKTDDRQRLVAIVADRNSPQKHVWRAQIVLLTADGYGTAEIMRRTDTSKTAVWRWQERFMTDGVSGLMRDKTRPSRIPPLSTEVEQHVVARTLEDPRVRRRTGQPLRWPKTGTACSRIGRTNSSWPMIHSSPPSCTRSSGSMSTRQPTPSCCRLMKRAKSRHSTAPSRVCP